MSAPGSYVPARFQRPALFVLLASFALGACSGSDDDEQQSEELDAGQTDSGNADSPEDDAQVEPGEDAASDPLDSGEPDAGEPDANMGFEGISLTLREGTEPVPRATVILHDAAGIALGSLLTDQLGQVHTSLLPSMITVLPPSDNLVLFQGALTYVGVEDGDDLIVELPARDQVPSELGVFRVTVPALAGATYYMGWAGNEHCVEFFQVTQGAQNYTFDIPITEACKSDSMDLFFAGMANGAPQAFAVMRAQTPPAPNQTATLTYNGTWASPAQFPVSASNLPNQGGISVDPFVGGQRVYTGGGLTEVEPNLWNTPYPAGLVNQFDINLGFSIDGVNENLYALFQQHTSDTSAVAFDGDEALAPMRLSAIDDGVPSRPIVALETAPQVADAAALFFHFELAENGGQGSTWYDWTFLVPPGIASFQVPELTDVASHFVENVGQSMLPDLINWSSSTFEGDTVENYRALRQEIIHFDISEGTSLSPDRKQPSSWRRTNWSPPGI